MRSIPSMFLPSIAFSLVACSSSGGSSDTPSNNNQTSSLATSQSSAQASSIATAQSHNAGDDCMSSGCHISGGSGPEFTVAGTVFRSGTNSGLAGASIKLYVPNTNTLLAELTTDSSGNFYTNEAIHGLNDGSLGAFGYDGVSPEVNGNSMPVGITSGSCNGCHGNGNGRLSSS